MTTSSDSETRPRSVPASPSAPASLDFFGPELGERIETAMRSRHQANIRIAGTRDDPPTGAE
jgi:hypothetical protein